jgi:hypothetical protein
MTPVVVKQQQQEVERLYSEKKGLEDIVEPQGYKDGISNANIDALDITKV